MKKSYRKKIIMLVLFCLLMNTTMLTACGGDDYTAEDLGDALERAANGEKLNREDSNMVEGFLEWKAEKNKYAD